MGIQIVEGDLLKSDCTMIMHQANCFAKMGAGIAKQISTEYPEVYNVDRHMSIPIGSKERLGKCSGAQVINKATGVPMLIVNVYGQYNYGRGKQTDYDALSWGIYRALTIFKEHTGKVGVPYLMGCNLAGGDWRIVSNILEDMSAYIEGNIYIYKLPGIE